MSKRTEALAFLAQEAHEHHTGAQAACVTGVCHRIREFQADADRDDLANLALRRVAERLAIPHPKDTEVVPPAARKQLQDALAKAAADAIGAEHNAIARDNAVLRLALEFGGQCSIGRLVRLEAVVGAVDALMVAALKLWPTAEEIPPEVRAHFSQVAATLNRMKQAGEDPLQTIRLLAATSARITERFDLETRLREAALQALVAHAVKVVQDCGRCGGTGTEHRLVLVEGATANQVPCAACGEWREKLEDLRAGGKVERIAPDAVKEGAG